MVIERAVCEAVIVVAAIAIVALSLCYVMAKGEIKSQAAEIAALKTQLADCERWARDADAAVARQNAAVEAARVDTVTIRENIKSVLRKYGGTREIVVESIKKDSSCENVLQNIDNAMRVFHGVRDANGN